MVPLLSLTRREAGARAFTPTRAGLNRGVLQARASGVLRGRKVKRSLRNPHNRIRARRPPWLARVPELLERVGAGEWFVWHRHPQETAERCPAFGDVEHQEALGHDLGGHLCDLPAVAGEGGGLVVGPAVHRLLDDYGG